MGKVVSHSLVTQLREMRHRIAATRQGESRNLRAPGGAFRVPIVSSRRMQRDGGLPCQLENQQARPAQVQGTSPAQPRGSGGASLLLVELIEQAEQQLQAN